MCMEVGRTPRETGIRASVTAPQAQLKGVSRVVARVIITDIVTWRTVTVAAVADDAVPMV